MSEVWVWEYDDDDDTDSHLLAWEFYSSEAMAKAAAQDHADIEANRNRLPVVPLEWKQVLPEQKLPFCRAVVDGKYLGFNRVHTYFVAQLRFVR